MKFKTYVRNSFIVFLFFYSFNSFSQFTSSVNNDVQVSSSSVQIQNTGTDIAYCSIYGVDLQVTVWDAGNTNDGIAYDDGSNTGVIQLAYSDAYDPDVTIIGDGSVFYAVVVYYSPGTSGGSYVLEYFDYNGTNLSSNTPILLQSGVPFENTINIDGNMIGDFAVVWDYDTGSSIETFLITGSIVSFIPTLNFGTPISLTPGNDSRFPDVCLWDSVITGTEIMYVCYVNGSGDIDIQEERWSNIDNGSPTINYALFDFITPTNNLDNFPRIACAASPADRYHLSVVWSENSIGLTEIYGYTYNSGSSPASTIRCYTDGSIMGTDLDLALNYLPVVAYDVSAYIYIGWTYNNSGPGYAGGGYHPGDVLPIVVQCDVDGAPFYSDFWDVPISIYGLQNTLSLAARHSSSQLVSACWYDDTQFSTRDVYHKAVIPGSSFRNSKANLLALINLQFVEIYDLQGRIIFSSNNKNEIKLKFEENSLKSGLYLVKTTYENGTDSCIYYKM